MVVPSCLEQRGWRGGGGKRGEEGVRLGREAKVRLKNTIESHKEKIRERKQNDSFAV